MGQAPKAGKYFEVVVAALGLVAATTASAFSQPLTDFPVFHLEVAGALQESGEGFAILNPSGRPHCLIVTVTHVAEPGVQVTVDGVRIDANSSRPAPIHTTAAYGGKLADGLIVLVPADNADLGDCAPISRAKNATTLLSSDQFGRLTYAECSGDLDTIKVVVNGDPRSPARLQVNSFGGRPIEPGLSGSPYSMNGQLLGVANSVDHGQTELIRLDTADLDPRYIASLPPPAPAAPRWQPFDRSRLPNEYREVSEAAYAIRQKAEAVFAAAEKTAAIVDEAAAAADLHAAGYGDGNITNTDRSYRGQTNLDGHPAGYGELRMLSGDDVGDILKGYFINDGSHSYLTGVGKIIYGNPVAHNNAIRVWGIFNHSDNKWWFMEGPTRRDFQNGDVLFKNATEVASKTFFAVYYRASDQTTFETLKDKDGYDNGPGVRWSADGQPLCVCVWKQGIVVSQWVPTSAQ